MGEDGGVGHPVPRAGELAAAGVKRSAARSASGLAARTTRYGVRIPRSTPTLEGRREHGRDRDARAIADAVAHERRRIAADVHDLIMQDLSFALAQARTIAVDPAQAPQARAVVAAGERALAGARRLLGGLADRDREPVIDAVRRSVRLAARSTPFAFDASRVPPNAQPDQATLDALVHIGREAVTNAIKHAHPTAVEVVLERADEWRLQVRDDGRGFEAIGAGAGFGVQSMRQHAEALGGTLRLSAGADAGTTVEAVLP